MGEHAWVDLPRQLRAAIEQECGEVVDAIPATEGRHSDFSATLRTTAGPVFAKGVLLDSPNMWMHRREARVNDQLPTLAPRLRWSVERDGWLVHGFEHVTGRYADLSPGSPDLALVADAVTEMDAHLSACPVGVPMMADQWVRLSPWRQLSDNVPADLDAWSRAHLAEFVGVEAQAADLVRGDSLLHTDLHPLNILISDRARVIDWAWARRGAPWVDAGFLVVRLIDAGHSPDEAQRWAAAIPEWNQAPDASRTAFAVAVLGMWEYLQRAHPLPHRPGLTNAVRQWARHRTYAGV